MQRLSYPVLGKNIFNAMLGVETELGKVQLDVFLKEIIKIRASQLNGCTFCLDMHIKTARKAGERELRIHHIAVWRESGLFDEQERMALELTEALTRMQPEGLSDALYEKALAAFGEQALVEVVFFIAQINAWNRLNVAFRTEIGSMDQIMGLEGVLE